MPAPAGGTARVDGPWQAIKALQPWVLVSFIGKGRLESPGGTAQDAVAARRYRPAEYRFPELPDLQAG